MYKATVLYNHPTDPDAFEDYYFTKHVELASKVPHISRLETALLAPNPDGSRPPFYRTAEMWFDDLKAMQASLGSAEGEATVADCSVFADGGFQMFISIVD